MADRYKNGKIYKLVSDMTDDIYIGSCCIPLCKRLYKHKVNNEMYKEGKRKHKCSASFLFELGGEVKIILLEEFPTDSKEKLLARERIHIENNKCVNMNLPIVFDDEKKYRKKEYDKTWNSKPEANEWKKEYYSQEAVKEQKKEQQRQSYAKHKDKIYEKQKEWLSKPEVKARRAELAKKRYWEKKQLKTLEASAPSL